MKKSTVMAEVKKLLKKQIPEAAVQIAPSVDGVSMTLGFPAICVLDAGGKNKSTGSDGIFCHKIATCVYLEALGDLETTTEETMVLNERIDEVLQAATFGDVDYVSESEVAKFKLTEKQNRDIVIKLGYYEIDTSRITI